MNRYNILFRKSNGHGIRASQAHLSDPDQNCAPIRGARCHRRFGSSGIATILTALPQCADRTNNAGKMHQHKRKRGKMHPHWRSKQPLEKFKYIFPRGVNPLRRSNTNHATFHSILSLLRPTKKNYFDIGVKTTC